MKLAIMQPYFVPYLGYFALIKKADHWIVFDTPQFTRHGWIERNRILKPVEGWQYIKIPLEKHPRNTAIMDIKIKHKEKWGHKILAQLIHYKKTPYYSNVINLVNEIILHDTKSIVDMDVFALSVVCNYLNIDFSYQIYSKSKFKIDKVNNPDEWAFEISKVLGAKIYYNLPGGIDFFDRDKYNQNNIELKFLKLKLKEYNQGRNKFESSLSIIDVMMFNSPEEINGMLNNYEFL